MTSVIHPTYFPNISHFVVLAQSETTLWEMHDNYQKQTFRNRMHIYGANGLLALTVPVIYSQKNRQLYKDIKISYAENWQSHHWKSIESAYRTSPFFEFYEDELRPLFENKPDFLLDHNIKCFETICECLQVDFNLSKTTAFHKEANNDYRFLVNTKKTNLSAFSSYTQVFSNKHGFISNLSSLDLLFNEGTNAINYLEEQLLPKNLIVY